MDAEIWQQLLSFENRDITSRWFEKIHGRTLNARRAKEINAAAKQAREYFRNASNADYSVRPLFTFYGVASLSRSLLLLLQNRNGEEVLTKGHGLETVDWATVISDGNGLSNAHDLKIRTCGGLFCDFMTRTKNRTAIHVRSSAVDWRLSYEIPAVGDEISLGELFARIPDLEKDYTHIADDAKYALVHDIRYDKESGFDVRVADVSFLKFKEVYDSLGYASASENGVCTVTTDAKNFEEQLPLLVQTYIQKNFGSIPRLYLAPPFNNGGRYSQLCITYMVSYILGMLARYYPTQWMALIQGEKGDRWWPTVNRAQHFVEKSYPELVVEFLMDTMNTEL
ncbi:YaaC family protein [Burkholderia gladioli]|uniref:YaaC family protein n=1 Tax=Burkholderia gladioli TaxID=28095 RepID=UPI003F7932E0